FALVGLNLFFRYILFLCGMNQMSHPNDLSGCAVYYYVSPPFMIFDVLLIIVALVFGKIVWAIKGVAFSFAMTLALVILIAAWR
ncbi:MAG: hypothetical protein KGQ59_03815, partial [Bdellovibrionales bacterium]|nr:hypothetical protein [Bdellovibrionales bacterium]